MVEYNVWDLLKLAESSGAKDCDERYYHENVTFDVDGDWKVVMFYDGDELDYIDSFITPLGEKIDFWKWDDSPKKNILTLWRGPGDLERLQNLVSKGELPDVT